MKKRNAKRRASEFARCYGSKARVAFVKAQGCNARLCFDLCEGPIDNAHVTGGGAGRKADARHIIALCRKHHETLHRIGVAAFERIYGFYLSEQAARFEAAWQSHVAVHPERK